MPVICIFTSSIKYISDMKKVCFALVLILDLIICLPSPAQKSSEKTSLTGSWLGKIAAGPINMRIIFNLFSEKNDSLVATLDSPDQGVKNIKMGTVTIDGDSLRIVAPLLLAEYNGIVQNDTLIKGTWKQAGKIFPLDIVKLRTDINLNRPQEPKPPYPYKSEEVSFTNSKFNIKLSGTLTVPKGDGPFPAVVLISGSGPQNRDEELMGHKPFLVLADYLTRNGIAVLRYDDRGFGKSQGDFITATSADLATDAEAAFTFLAKRDDIQNEGTGLIGHSEGGLIASVVASTNREVAFVISLAGTGVPGEQIILRQSADISRASGVNEDKILESEKTNKRLFDVLKKENDNMTASEKMVEQYKMIMLKNNYTEEEIENGAKEIKSSLNPAGLSWFRYFLKTDPAKFWKKVKCPVLALNGEKDLQVAADENLPAIEKALKSSGNKSSAFIMLPGLNHLFQPCTTGLPAEYVDIEETISPEVLKIISDWILGL